MAAVLANVAQVLTFDKLTGVADLLDALTAVIGSDSESFFVHTRPVASETDRTRFRPQ